MSINIRTEESIAVGIESTSGQPAALTLEAHSLLCESWEMNPEGGAVDRKGYPRASMGELRPLASGNGSYSASIVWPVHFVTSAVGGTDDTDWDDRGADALLRACGLSVTQAAGTRTYAPQTGGSLETCTIESTHGPLWMQTFGAAGNMTWAGSPGEPSKMTFGMKGVYRPAVSDAISGTSFSEDFIAPPVVDRMTLEIGSWTSPVCTGFSFDLGNDVQPQQQIALLQLPVYRCLTYDDSATTFVNETTDINDTDVGDVIVFTSNTGGTNLNDYIAFGSRHPFDGVKLTLGTAGAGTHTVTWQYWNGSSWTTLSTFGRQGITNFQQTAGTYFNEWGRPSDWATTTLNSITAYWVRAIVTAFTTYTTQPLLTQGWNLVNGFGAQKYVIVDRAPRLTLNIETEATATFDPEDDFEDGTARNITLSVGTADNNTTQLTLTSAYVAARPKKTVANGIAHYEVTYALNNGDGTSTFSLLFT